MYSLTHHPLCTVSADFGAHACTPCAAGTVDHDANSSTPCTVCGLGASSEAGATACAQCAAGTYGTYRGASSAPSCQSCPAGTFNVKPGSVSSQACSVCARGRYSDASAATACEACPAGRYLATPEPQANTETHRSACYAVPDSSLAHVPPRASSARIALAYALTARPPSAASATAPTLRTGSASRARREACAKQANLTACAVRSTKHRRYPRASTASVSRGPTTCLSLACCSVRKEPRCACGPPCSRAQNAEHAIRATQTGTSSHKASTVPSRPPRFRSSTP